MSDSKKNSNRQKSPKNPKPPEPKRSKKLYYGISLIVLLISISAFYLLLQNEENGNGSSESSWSQFKSLFYRNLPPQTFLSTIDLILRHGYGVDEHKIMSDDGYVISILRISQGKKNKKRKGQQQMEPVVLHHGFLSSYSDWFIRPGNTKNDDALPFLLAEAGKDVWVVSGRGTNQSNTHSFLTPNDLKYWDFSFQDQAVHDAPAIIEYILDTTGSQKLSWGCHSMGCTILYIAVNDDETLNDKIDKVVALAPTVYFTPETFPFGFKAYSYFKTTTIKGLFDVGSGGRMFPSWLNNGLKKYLPHLCSGKIGGNLCSRIINLIYGASIGGDEIEIESFLPSRVLAQTPAEVSGKSLLHFLQWLDSWKFEGYDYGVDGNKKKYGTIAPPPYSLAKVKVKSLIIFSAADKLVTPAAIEKIKKELGGSVELFELPDKTASHTDFLYSKETGQIVYEKIIKYL